MTISHYTLSQQHVHIWMIDLTFSRDTSGDVLSREEMVRAERFIDLQSKRHYMTCRSALRNVLSYYMDLAPECILFTYNANGKPYIAPSQNTHQLQFNVSHHEEACCIAITASQEIGVDIESMSGPSLEDAMEMFISQSEKEALPIVTGERSTSLIHLWTQKEALLKARGTGLQSDPKQIHGYVTHSFPLINRPLEGYKLNSFTMGTSILSLCTEHDIHYDIKPYESLEKQKNVK